jgi:hypothetical protein
LMLSVFFSRSILICKGIQIVTNHVGTKAFQE